jgi:hypothetical protein
MDCVVPPELFEWLQQLPLAPFYEFTTTIVPIKMCEGGIKEEVE